MAIGVDRIRPNISWNEERLYAPDGKLVTTYHKHHLLPHWEDQFTPSTTRSTREGGFGHMGTADLQGHGFPAFEPAVRQRRRGADDRSRRLTSAWMDGHTAA